MAERQKRLKEVFEYLRNNCGIHTQIDFAESLHKSRNAISLALNGNELYLTDRLFRNICETYPGVFNLNYLLTGEGSLLTIDKELCNEDHGKMVNQQPIDHSSLVNAALAAKDETIRALEGSLRDKERIIQLLEKELKDLKQNAENQGVYPRIH